MNYKIKRIWALNKILRENIIRSGNLIGNI
jgi:hypothetical protein